MIRCRKYKLIGVCFTKVLSHTARYISVNAFLFLISACTYGAAAQSRLILCFPAKRSDVNLQCYPPLLFADLCLLPYHLFPPEESVVRAVCPLPVVLLQSYKTWPCCHEQLPSSVMCWYPMWDGGNAASAGMQVLQVRLGLGSCKNFWFLTQVYIRWSNTFWTCSVLQVRGCIFGASVKSQAVQ